MESHHERRSPLDRLLAWIQSLPIPAWLFFAIHFTVIALYMTGVGQLYGTAIPANEVSSWDDAIWPTAFFAIIYYLTTQGGQSLLRFKPLIPQAEERYTALESRISRIPPRVFWPTVLIGQTIMLIGLLTSFTPMAPNQPLARVARGLEVVFVIYTMSLMAVMAVVFVRQVRVIMQLHREAEGLSLYQLDAPHAFSELTSRFGSAMILLLIPGVLQNIGDPTVFFFTLLAIQAVMGILAFVLPLAGMRRRLVDLKKEELARANQRIEAAAQRVNAQADAGSYEGLGQAKTAIDALTAVRDELKRISTLPWDTGAFRGFASSILLPIILFIATQLIGRFL